MRGGGGWAFKVNYRGLLVRAGEHGPQIVVPHSLKERILHVTHYAKLADRPDDRILYYLICRNFHWPDLTDHCHAKVRQRPHCARKRIKLRQNVAELQLFPAEPQLKSVHCVLILDLQQKSKIRCSHFCPGCKIPCTAGP